MSLSKIHSHSGKPSVSQDAVYGFKTIGQPYFFTFRPGALPQKYAHRKGNVGVREKVVASKRTH